MAYFLKTKFERTEGQTDGHMDKRADGQSDYTMPQTLFVGHKKAPTLQVCVSCALSKMFFFLLP